MLEGLTKKQNEGLKALHVNAIDEAERFLKFYRMSNLRKYLVLAKCELVKARAYFDLGNFEEDPRYREM